MKDTQYFVDALRLLVETGDDTAKETFTVDKNVEMQAAELYRLLHSQYVLTKEGLGKIRERYIQGVYGHCPRVYCNSHVVFPVGLDDRPGISNTKCFCPKCRDIYDPVSKLQSIDGSAFGRSLPHLALQQYPDLCPVRSSGEYSARIYGFRLHHDAYELRKYRGEEEGGGGGGRNPFNELLDTRVAVY